MPSINKKKRNRLLRERDKKCVYCGSETKVMTLDHKIPKSRGGKGDDKNLVISCRDCNFDKANLTYHEYKLILRYRAAKARANIK